MNRLPVYCLIFFLIVFSVNCQAQCPSDKYQWDFSASYGMMFTSINNTNNNLEGTRSITQSPYATYVTIRYFIYNRLALGVAAGIATEKGTYSSPLNPALNGGNYSFNTVAVAVELYYIYTFRKYLELYAFAGAGPASSVEKTYPSSVYGIGAEGTNTESVFKGQFTPIGIRLGGRLGGYAELGYGYKGILNLGISIKLGPSCWWVNDFR